MRDTPAKFLSHTISIYVANKPGVLVRVAQVFSRRGFNIDSLVVSPGQAGNFSRMTVTAQGDPDELMQIISQLQKLIDVQKATEHSHQVTIEKELAMIKVAVKEGSRSEVLQLVDHFKAATVDFCEGSLIIQITGSTEKLDAFIALLKNYRIIEIVRTGKVLMARGEEVT
ncbi:MAG TPA: acetolactate synthase small subunit [Spirochaetota bacterium]|nr:acetolactate synthase small subunit [Spirochaetota bacterium]